MVDSSEQLIEQLSGHHMKSSLENYPTVQHKCDDVLSTAYMICDAFIDLIPRAHLTSQSESYIDQWCILQKIKGVALAIRHVM